MRTAIRAHLMQKGNAYIFNKVTRLVLERGYSAKKRVNNIESESNGVKTTKAIEARLYAADGRPAPPSMAFPSPKPNIMPIVRATQMASTFNRNTGRRRDC